jgi:hypothetical protein
MTESATYRVTFRGRLSEEARTALSSAGIRWVSGHGGHAVGPGGDLPEIDSQTVHVQATDESDAKAKVRDAVSPHGAFGEFLATAAPEEE